MWFANISPSLWLVLFKEQKLLILTKFSLLSLLLLNVILVLYLRNCYLTKPEKFPLYFLLEVLVLDITLKPMNHFELTFVWGMDWSFGSFLHVNIQLFQYHWLKRPPFLHWMAFAPLLTIYVWMYFWMLFCFIDLFVFLPVPHILSWLL